MDKQNKPPSNRRSLLEDIPLDQCTFEHEFYSGQMAFRAPPGKVFSVNGRFSAHYHDTSGADGYAVSKDEYLADNTGAQEDLDDYLRECKRYHEDEYRQAATEPWLKLSDEEYWDAVYRDIPEEELSKLLSQDEEEYWRDEVGELSIMNSFEGKWLLFEPHDGADSSFTALSPDNALDFKTVSVASVSARVSGAGSISVLKKELSPFPDHEEYLVRDPTYRVTLGQWIVKLAFATDQATVQLIDKPEDEGLYIPAKREKPGLIVPYPNQDPSKPGYEKDAAFMRARIDALFDAD